jgi:hypothetical protein
MNINEILKGLDCKCGKRHDCDIKYVYVERGAAEHLREITKNYQSILIVADGNTYSAGGLSCEEQLFEKQVHVG